MLKKSNFLSQGTSIVNIPGMSKELTEYFTAIESRLASVPSLKKRIGKLQREQKKTENLNIMKLSAIAAGLRDVRRYQEHLTQETAALREFSAETREDICSLHRS